MILDTFFDTFLDIYLDTFLDIHFLIFRWIGPFALHFYLNLIIRQVRKNPVFPVFAILGQFLVKLSQMVLFREGFNFYSTVHIKVKYFCRNFN